jgi:hypothetical protein
VLELFHRIAEPDSARARQLVLDRALTTLVQFRNVGFPEAAAALQSHGGVETPALWDGERLATGLEAVSLRLSRLSR